MVWPPSAIAVEFHDVSNDIVYILWYTFGKVRDTTLYSLFYMIIKLDKLLSQIDSVVQKG